MELKVLRGFYYSTIVNFACANFSLTLYLLLYCTRLVLHAFMCSIRLAAVAILLLAYCQPLQVIYVHVSATLYGLRCVSLPQYSVRTCGRGHACMPVMSIHSWTGVCAVLSFESTCPVCVVQITPSSAAVSTQLLMFSVAQFLRCRVLSEYLRLLFIFFDCAYLGSCHLDGFLCTIFSLDFSCILVLFDEFMSVFG